MKRRSFLSKTSETPWIIYVIREEEREWNEREDKDPLPHPPHGDLYFRSVCDIVCVGRSWGGCTDTHLVPFAGS